MPPFGLTKKEYSILKKLSTPSKIQDFINKLTYNRELNGETYMSPRLVIREKTAHCFEGALLAVVALWIQGEKALLLDLRSNEKDIDHVVVLYKKNGYWGAISKTGHYCLRFRDPIYKTVREVALSYFHEYFLNKNGEKTLVSYSAPFNLKKFGTEWITSDEILKFLVLALDKSPHFPIVPKKNHKYIRKADPIERKVGEVVEWD
jgi:hypothetical protein